MNDGGPAFPRPAGAVQQGCEQFSTDQEGMPLRDYFAAKFAAAWIIALAARRNEEGYSDESAAIEANRLGLRQADAMLFQRQQGQSAVIAEYREVAGD